MRTFVAVSASIPPSEGSLPAVTPNNAPPASCTKMHRMSEVTNTADHQ